MADIQDLLFDSIDLTTLIQIKESVDDEDLAGVSQVAQVICELALV